MDKTPDKDSYILQLEKLKVIIETANNRVISEPLDDFFHDNANFFTKSFLVIIFQYL